MVKCNKCTRMHDDINLRTNQLYAECSVCREDRRKRQKARREASICLQCGGPSEGRARCSKCHSLVKQRLRENGKCRNCGRDKDTDKAWCKRCTVRGIAKKNLGSSDRWEELQTLFESQQGLCSVTGLPIEIGCNASIDHIVPRNRSGGNGLSNLRWVHIGFNRMKNDLMDYELLDWARMIVASEDRLHLQVVDHVGPPDFLKAPKGRTHSWPSGTTT